MSSGRLSTQMFLGVLILLVGLALLIDNLGVADFSPLYRWIPSLFILLGAWQLVRGGFRHWTGPLILIVGGSLFQLSALDVITGAQLGQLIWPLALIVVGFSILMNRSRRGQEGAPADYTEKISSFTLLSGAQRHLTSQSFRGGEVTSIFGGTDLDLRDARVQDRPATLSVFSMFGGTKISVPEDWAIQVDVFGLFGGTEDNRRSRPVPPSGVPELRVTGVAMFGSVEIDN